MENEVNKKSVGIREEKGQIPVEREGADSELTGRERSLANLTARGRPKGVPNKINKTIRDAVLEAVQPGACHAEGLTGWLKDRALGGIEDRKIFAGMVSRVIPVEITGAGGGPVKIDLGWLTERRIGGGDVVDATYTTQHAGEQGDKPVESIGYEGGAPDVISDEEDKS